MEELGIPLRSADLDGGPIACTVIGGPTPVVLLARHAFDPPDGDVAGVFAGDPRGRPDPWLVRRAAVVIGHELVHALEEADGGPRTRTALQRGATMLDGWRSSVLRGAAAVRIAARSEGAAFAVEAMLSAALGIPVESYVRDGAETYPPARLEGALGRPALLDLLSRLEDPGCLQDGVLDDVRACSLPWGRDGSPVSVVEGMTDATGGFARYRADWAVYAGEFMAGYAWRLGSPRMRIALPLLGGGEQKVVLPWGAGPRAIAETVVGLATRLEG